MANGRFPQVAPVAAFALLLMVGCRAINLDADYVPDSSKATGVVVASLTRSGTPGFNMFVALRGVDNDYKNSVPVSDAFAPSDWECPFTLTFLGRFHTGTIPEDPPCGRLAVLELPRGEYEFYSWHGASGNRTVRASTGFSKRFKIISGKAVYLGNIHITIVQGEWGSGGGTFEMKVRDKRERDLPLLATKNPGITSERIVISILPD